MLIVTTEILRNTLFNKLIAYEQEEEMPLAFDLVMKRIWVGYYRRSAIYQRCR